MRMGMALAFGVGGMDAVVVALAGFLLRGGVVLLALPSVVLPSVIGIAGVTGIDAVGIDGRPTPWLFEIVAIFGVAVILWLALASLIGSLIDVWLIEATVDAAGRPVRRGRPLPELGLLLDMVAVRGICLLPVAAALAWASARVYTVAYNELTTPSNLATPLPVRVVENAMDAVVVVSLAWLVTETIAALAVRDGHHPRRHGDGLRLVPRRRQEPAADRDLPRPWPAQHDTRLPTGGVRAGCPRSLRRLGGGGRPVRDSLCL